MNPGKHIAKIVSYGISLGKDGKSDSVFVNFQNEAKEEITWFGSLSTAAAEYTLKTLIQNLGLMIGPDEVGSALERIAVDGIDSGLLNTEKSLELVVEPDTYNGKTRNKIKYINEVGAVRGFEKLAAEKAKGRFSSLNLAGTVADLNSKLPTPPKKGDDIPF